MFYFYSHVTNTQCNSISSEKLKERCFPLRMVTLPGCRPIALNIIINIFKSRIPSYRINHGCNTKQKSKINARKSITKIYSIPLQNPKGTHFYFRILEWKENYSNYLTQLTLVNWLLLCKFRLKYCLWNTSLLQYIIILDHTAASQNITAYELCTP